MVLACARCLIKCALFCCTLTDEVGDEYAREKVGQTLRDLLHNRYKSSTAAKRVKRQRLNRSTSTTSAGGDSASASATSENDDSGHMSSVPDEVEGDTAKRLQQQLGDSMDATSMRMDRSADGEWSNLFNQSNIDMLQAIKTENPTVSSTTTAASIGLSSTSAIAAAVVPSSSVLSSPATPFGISQYYHHGPSSHHSSHQTNDEEEAEKERQRRHDFHPPN